MSRPTALVCGDVANLPADLSERFAVHAVTTASERTQVDPVLAGLDGARLLVCGTDADLAAVVTRLLRTERLAEVEVALLPSADSPFAALWSLPTEPRAALRLAETGRATGVPFLRSDSGGVIVARGVLAPARDVVAYCDDTRLLRGDARAIEVAPDPAAGLRVRISRRLRPALRAGGRALQLGFADAAPVNDGVRHPRQVQRWTWYRHLEDLRLVREG